MLGDRTGYQMWVCEGESRGKKSVGLSLFIVLSNIPRAKE